ncbi:hypothetical protein H0H93_003385, partial [Arthromyces matolae]
MSPNHVFAIVIGINKYPKHTDLNGAVGDADRISEWLASVYGVLGENIINLRDGDATGAGIRAALYSLVSNEMIRPNSIVIVYYAGHGASTDAPESWNMANNEVQMILPSDFDPKLTNDEVSKTGPGRPILDIEFGNIIEEISAKKGGLPVVAMLDCCFAGSGTRGNDGFIVRGGKLPAYNLPKNAFSSSMMRNSFLPDRRSHILLAACSSKERAYEVGGHGLFTDAFLDISHRPNFKDLTFSDLLNELKGYTQLIEKQTPHLEGFGLDRTVFTLEPRRSSQPVIYTVQGVKEAPKSFRLAGGRKNGIANGAQFTLHADKNCTSPKLASIMAEDTQPSVTICSVLPCTSEALTALSLHVVLYAVQTRRGHPLRLFLDQNDPHYLRWKTLLDEHVNDISIRSIQLVQPGEEADLAISADGENLLFEVKNMKCRDYGAHKYLSCRDARVDDPDHKLLGILRGAVNFFFHLDLPNISALRNEPLEVECLEVYKESRLKPWISKPNAVNLNSDYRIYIVETEDAAYSFEVKNNSSTSLYAAVFVFDVHNLQISRYDLLNDTVNSSVCLSLPAGQSLRIGIGDSGVPPRTFVLPNGQDRDLSFLKIFVCDTRRDYSGIEQDSPFNDETPRDYSGTDQEAPFSDSLAGLRGYNGPAKSDGRSGNVEDLGHALISSSEQIATASLLSFRFVYSRICATTDTNVLPKIYDCLMAIIESTVISRMFEIIDHLLSAFVINEDIRILNVCDSDVEKVALDLLRDDFGRTLGEDWRETKESRENEHGCFAGRILIRVINAGKQPIYKKAMVAVGNTLYSTNSGSSVLLLGLRSAAGLAKCPLQSLEKSLPVFVRQILDIIQQTGSTEAEVVQVALKSLSTILRDGPAVQVKEKDLVYLLELIAPDLEDPERQTAAFAMLRAIVVR